MIREVNKQVGKNKKDKTNPKAQGVFGQAKERIETG